jgi:hypothetical protein
MYNFTNINPLWIMVYIGNTVEEVNYIRISVDKLGVVVKIARRELGNGSTAGSGYKFSYSHHLP